MRFSQTMTYDAPADAVYAMLADPEFREQVCAAANTSRHDVTITPKGAGMTVVVDQVQPADGVPSFARKFVGDQIEIRQEESWTDSSGGRLDVSIPGKPGHFKGTITLEGDGSRTTETVAGEIKVHIPLVGGKLEKLIGDLLGSALRSEERVGRSWLG